MSAAEALVRGLRAKGVTFEVTNGRIAFQGPEGVLTQSDLDEMKEFKPEILLLFNRSCRLHNDQRNYVDVVLKSGWIRTTCRVCGRFVGYRPLGVGAEPDYHAEPNMSSNRNHSISGKATKHDIQF